LIKNLRKNSDFFYKIHDIISTLDVVYSFSKYSLGLMNATSTSPKFNQAELNLKDSSHPILNSLIVQKKTTNKIVNAIPIVNDIHASVAQPFILITGANMSGKSTLLKQIGIHQIMAQCGSNTPASSGIFQLKKQIFSRAGESIYIFTEFFNFEFDTFESLN
jgi:DNA mismatch repair protein MSH4